MVDHLARFVGLVGSSLPVFWLGLIVLYLLYVRARLVPRPGPPPSRVDPPPDTTGLYTIDSLLDGDFGLAWRCLAPTDAAGVRARLGPDGHRVAAGPGGVLDELHADYVRTARAMGLREGDVMRHHVLRNALHAGDHHHGAHARRAADQAVLTETVFSWNGIGTYAVEATQRLDYPGDQRRLHHRWGHLPAEQPVADVLYAAVDPKIRYA